MLTAYDEGVIAAKEGLSKDANPYDPITQDWGYADWEFGFESAEGSK